MANYPNRKVVLIGPTRVGKTTFVTASAKPPLYVIDADRNFGGFEPAVKGQVIYPKDATGYIDPLAIYDQAEAAVMGMKIGAIVVDSVTPIYSTHARRAHMQNRRGLNKNKAAAMIDKADAIATLTNIASFGTEMWYLWHETTGIDGAGASITKETISPTERDRLFRAVNIVLKLSVVNGRYTAYVDPQTRAWGNRKPNTGWSYTDPEDNYWAGAMDFIERMVYTSFTGPDEAQRWLKRELGLTDLAEAKDFYDHIKSQEQPKRPSEMWMALVREVDAVLANRAPADTPREEIQAEEEKAQVTEEALSG
jgi:hypothetical protein